MSDVNSVCQNLQNQINELLQQRSSLRQKEKELKLREAALSGQYQVKGGKALREHLENVLPSRLLPRNVGKATSIAWPFYYAFDFDLGVNPALTSETRQERSITISQEAGFIIAALSLSTRDNSNAAYRAPLTLTLRDAQSTRQFNDLSFPLQTIATNSTPSNLYTGYLIMPNSRLTAEIRTWVPATITHPSTGDGRFQIMVHGVRVPINDLKSVMQTSFENIIRV